MTATLVQVQPDACHFQGSHVYINKKTLSGLLQYAKYWPGDLRVLAPNKAVHKSNQYALERIADLPFDIHPVAANEAINALRTDAAATLVPLIDKYKYLFSTRPDRIVTTAEFGLRERIQIDNASNPKLSRAIRAYFGRIRREPIIIDMVRKSGGVAANGYPAYQAYGRLAQNILLFFDTRISMDDIQAGEKGSSRLIARSGLRLGFSGRHTDAKGPQFALAAAERLLQRGIPLTLDIMGEGESTHKLKERFGYLPQIRFLGSLDFKSEWLPHLRHNIDLMVLPHVQGDPSGTYLETAATSTPVLSFNNSAFRPLARKHGLGWVTPMRDIEALASKIEQLSLDHEQLHRAGRNGADFMRQHTVENEFKNRVHQIRQIAQV